jgi:hypothetical protein
MQTFSHRLASSCNHFTFSARKTVRNTWNEITGEYKAQNKLPLSIFPPFFCFYLAFPLIQSPFSYINQNIPLVSRKTCFPQYTLSRQLCSVERQAVLSHVWRDCWRVWISNRAYWTLWYASNHSCTELWAQSSSLRCLVTAANAGRSPFSA